MDPVVAGSSPVTHPARFFVFVPPPGLTFDRLVGRGTTFEVAVVVAHDGARLVAKRLRPSLRASDDAQAALEREAAVLKRLEHPCVPRLVSFAHDAAGPCLLETLLEGPSFRALLEAPRPLDARAARALAEGAARLLFELQSTADAASPLGFVHGDLCPEHFVVTRAGRGVPPAVGLVDFGSATVAGALPPPESGRGTLPFAAPELCRGETGATPATDRYALAVVIAQLLTGVRLSRATTEPAMLVEIGERGHDVACLASLPTPTREALAAHLAFEPEGRPADLRALVGALADTA